MRHRLSNAPILAFNDNDSVAPSDRIGSVEAAFVADPDADVQQGRGAPFNEGGHDEDRLAMAGGHLAGESQSADVDDRSSIDNRSDETVISVVVPTRNRPDHLGACVASILACDDRRFSVVVVDQSDDDSTKQVIDNIPDDRVRHVPTKSRGAANARNDGVAATDGPVVAFTDDDCRVDRNWIGALRRAMADPSVGMVFGAVVMGETQDPTAEAAEFEPRRDGVVHDLPPVSEPWGISASMAIRRGVIDEVGGFDGMLGPGAPINTGGEDSDLFIRVLAAGHGVALTSDTCVTHLGFRSGDEAASLYRGYAYALGAVFMKHLRLRTEPGWDQLPRWIAHFGRQATVNMARGRGTNGAGFALGLARGAVAGARLPIDRASRRFVVEGLAG